MQPKEAINKTMNFLLETTYTKTKNNNLIELTKNKLNQSKI